MVSPWQWIITDVVLAGASSWVLADWDWKIVVFWCLLLLWSFPSSGCSAISLEWGLFHWQNLGCFSNSSVNHNLWYFYPTEKHEVQTGVLTLSYGAVEAHWTLLTAVIQTCTGCAATSSSELLLALIPAPLCAIDMHLETYPSRSMFFASWTYYLISN